MSHLSRRDMLAALAATGASILVPPRSLAATPPWRPARPWSPAELQDAAGRLLAYFARSAPQLLRAPDGVLARPNIAPSLPGRRYSTTLWDWDTLWTAQGLFRLAELKRDPELRRKVADHARGSLLIFLDHQSAAGRIPMLLSTVDADPLGCLKPAPMPNPRNQAKPVFGQLALMTADAAGDVGWLAPHFDRLLGFYRSWTANNRSAAGLLVWGDDVAIGNDNDPTTYGRPNFSSANLLLNTLYHQDLVASAELARRLGRPEDQRRLSAEAEALGADILKYCWDPRDRFFYTVDTQCVDHRSELIKFSRGMDMSWKCLPLKIQTFTGFLPLWSGMATKQQATALVETHYFADQRFRGDWGVRSLSRLESMYCMDASSNPSNWLGPVWIIVNYFVWRALKNYGFESGARDLGDKTVMLLAADLDAHGSLNEYYHPDSGEPLSHPGFMDWNLLVLAML